jgi:hypothetical protein
MVTKAGRMTVPRRTALPLVLHACAPACAIALVLACSSSSPAENTDAAPLGYSSCPDDLPDSCPTPAPSWKNEVQAIVEERCVTCHSPGGQEPQYDYTTYAGVFKEHVTMEAQLLSCIMPPNTAEAPTDAERATLLAWFVCGAPDN